MSTASIPMSNIQLELLKLYATNISDNELLEIKRYLAKFFMQKAIAAADQAWDEKGYTEEQMEEWLEE
jgi:predicted metal-binding transcription factor (methanogenesis marker protein 9)